MNIHEPQTHTHTQKIRIQLSQNPKTTRGDEFRWAHEALAPRCEALDLTTAAPGSGDVPFPTNLRGSNGYFAVN